MLATSIFPFFCRIRLLACALILLTLFGAPLSAETGDLPALRGRALELVNEAQREHGREPLTFSEKLNQAAQGHAEDMLARDYYGHVSPEGEDARDRYLARGGGRWELVAENIASCTGCGEVPTVQHVEQMHQGWMESPHHRENILSAGVTQFGFGIVAGDRGRLFAVQTFAGPGTPHGTEDAAAGRSAPLQAEDADQAFARALNARRQDTSKPPLEVSEKLSATAAELLPDSADEEVTLGRGALEGTLQGDWASVSAVAGSCGGCGADLTEADIGYFLEMWLDDPGYADRLLGPGPTSVGFALRAYGGGRKIAVAVLGERR